MRAAAPIRTNCFGWGFAHLLAEAAEELRGNGHPNIAAVHNEQLRKWLEVNDRIPTTEWRPVTTLYALRRWNEVREHLSAHGASLHAMLDTFE